MNHPKYDLNTNADATIFEFTSSGPKGNIIKIIKYSPMKNKDVFNLGFGDKIKINKNNKSFHFLLMILTLQTTETEISF